MTDLGDVLVLIRTRADLHRWSAANAHGVQMHRAVDILRDEGPADPEKFYTVTTKAIASATKVIMRADDSSGIIGDAVRRLLKLHPQAATLAGVDPAKLVKWLIDYQFSNECDFFMIDPVAYGPALGKAGMNAYREQLAAQETALGPRPEARWQGHAWFVVDWNAQRLAVYDRDVTAIIATHSRDRQIAKWLQDTAQALAEIEEYDLAIDWARQATFFDEGHQSLSASRYWCDLLAQHQSDGLLAARVEVFRRWPSSSTAAGLYRDAGPRWPEYAQEVRDALAQSPRDAVLFALFTLEDPGLAWAWAHALEMDDDGPWDDLIKAYARTDPLAVLPAMDRRVRLLLVNADAGNYRAAARQLKTMRTLAKGTAQAQDVDALIAQLRQEHRRRPRLQQEFDRAGLPKLGNH